MFNKNPETLFVSCQGTYVRQAKKFKQGTISKDEYQKLCSKMNSGCFTQIVTGYAVLAGVCLLDACEPLPLWRAYIP